MKPMQANMITRRPRGSHFKASETCPTKKQFCLYWKFVSERNLYEHVACKITCCPWQSHPEALNGSKTENFLSLELLILSTGEGTYYEQQTKTH